jgi:hypothetical protein
MASKKRKPLAVATPRAQRGSSADLGRAPYKPPWRAALAALRRSLDRAREPELRERLSLAIAELEGRQA